MSRPNLDLTIYSDFARQNLWGNPLKLISRTTESIFQNLEQFIDF